MEDYIAISKNSKEILNSAHLLQSVEVNALISGEPGVGKKSLAKYILPKAPLFKAKNLQQDIADNIINLQNCSIIIDRIENITNVDLLIHWVNDNGIRLIATTMKDDLNSKLAELFSIVIELPPLKDREEDVKALTSKFSKEASATLDLEMIIPSRLMINISNNAHSLRKSIYFSYLFETIGEDEILMFMENYMFANMHGEDSYKDFLYLLEVPMLKAASKKYKSQVQMAKHLGLNRITLRKKLDSNKDFWMISQLNVDIEELISKNAKDFEISKIFRNYFKEYVSTIDTTVETTGGKDFFVKHTKHTDKFLISLYKYILRKHFRDYQPMSASVPITLVALGSYGREQLCIYSDVDLMLLYEDIPGYNLRAIMEDFITLAWDCGLKLGSRVHEVKDIAEAVKEDITIKTSILESRMIYGSKHLWFGYENVLRKIRKTDQREFVLEKLEEHKQRLLKHPLKMEPNIKDGYGGMREANMVFWMATVIYGVTDTKQLVGKEFSEEEFRKYRSALEYIFQVRNALHNIAKKKLDVVNFDILPELSSKLGFIHTPRMTKERQCMAKILEALHRVHFFSAAMVKKFTRSILFDKKNIPTLRANRFNKNIYIVNNRVYTSFFAKAKSLNSVLKEFIELPNSIESFDRSYVFYVSKTKLPSKQTNELKKTIKTLLAKPNLYPFMKLIYNGRLFQSVIPIAKKIVNQPQFDGYHQHPVDIHSIKTLKKLQEIKDPYIQEVYDSLEERQRAMVRLVALLHDVGKGRVTDHHISGEKLFRKMTTVYGFDEECIEVGAILVRYHNMMSKVASNEDIYSEKVILAFTALLKRQIALKMLYVVTYADISAVGDSVYKSSTSSLLRQLYLQALPAFENKDLLSESVRRHQKEETIKNSKRFKELSNIKKKKIMYISSNQMFLQLRAKEIIDIAMDAYDVKDFKYEICNDTNLRIKIIRAIPLNLGYMLGKLEFLNISTLNIFKLYDEKKYFEIRFSEGVDEGDVDYVRNVIESSFDMSKKTKLLIPEIKKKNIQIDCNHSAYLAAMHVTAKDQKGLFAYIAKIFDDFGVEIESAKLSSIKDVANDLFLIEKNGNFCAKQDEIKNEMCNYCKE